MVDFTTPQAELVVATAVIGQLHVDLNQGMVVTGSMKNIVKGIFLQGSFD